jgi:secreted Zn-dependent insulinase-like peptidase
MELDRLLQIFASFFKNPVFKDEVIKRFIKTIDSKYD